MEVDWWFNKLTIYNTREYFLNILKKRDFDAYYIHKYKDQKAFCYFNSGLVWQIYVYELSSKKGILFAYCDVRASQSIHEKKNLWIIDLDIDNLCSVPFF